MKKIRTHLLASLCVLIVACGNHGRQVADALSLAGDNRGELEKVLEHYKNDACKLEAARFLIGNMPGAYGVNPQVLEDCRLFYEAYDSLGRAYNYKVSTPWGGKVDKLWKDFRATRLIRQEPCSDVTTLKAETLIAEIELAFRAWQANIYSQKASFEEFCEYILPYRRHNGLLIDSARHEFYRRHHHQYFVYPGKDWQEEIDSLLYEYRNLTHSNFWGTEIPIYNAGTFEQLRHGLCAHRCWYNSLLLSALGMPVATDFVPAWGNRNNSHTWNVVMINGQSHAFEAFWDNDRWKYKRIYNNRTKDELWGEFRLPKVYRYTFSNHIEGPLADPEVERADIPDLFRNIKKMDVSEEYFKTADVTVELTLPQPKGAKYVYLAVFDYQEWHPVQWGKIEKGKAVFRKMGRDMVYLPVYYKQGMVLPAAEPFRLKEDGEKQLLSPGKETQSVCIRAIRGVAAYDHNRDYIGCMRGSRFLGLEEGEEAEELYLWNDSLSTERIYREVRPSRSYRYVRLILPSETIALGELAFYTKQGRVEQAKILTPLVADRKNEIPELLTDGIDATAYQGKAVDKVVDIDLGKECRIVRIGMTPYLRAQLIFPEEFELRYWKNGWVSVKRKRANESGYLVFEDVPVNALLMVKNCRWKGRTVERPFTYDKGVAHWE